jgi:hypothetical protein
VLVGPNAALNDRSGKQAAVLRPLAIKLRGCSTDANYLLPVIRRAGNYSISWS